ncbi:MAG: phosphoribosylglycinamide formyltransferase [Robiginitomaculum sp.]|nr:phosphoribosylglycinamide formyltransferase [Robiginitomaculum sp.]
MSRKNVDQKVKTAVLISGGGSNMVALVQAAQAPDFPAEIVLVISNRPDAAGIAKAEELGVKTLCIDHKNFKTRKKFEQAMDKTLRAHGIELICNAGFMRILSPWFVGSWRGRQLNIHPSLLPKFKGLHTHERAIEAGETEHGCTIHYVDEGMDTGKIIAQAKVKVLPNDTTEALAARVLKAEHKLYPQILMQIASEELQTQN